MSSPDKHQPKHRAPAARRAPKAALRSSLTLSAMAVVGTGLAVSGGAVLVGNDAGDAELVSASVGDVAGDVMAGAAVGEGAAAEGESTPSSDAAALNAPRDALGWQWQARFRAAGRSGRACGQ